jgi:Trp operon repressor
VDRRRDNWEPVDTLQDFATQTPLENLLGVPLAEEIYDSLTLREQIILDLLIVDWTQAEIAICLGVHAPSIASSVRRMRFKLARSKLRTLLDSRVGRRYNEL